jgi:hypothetical protein
MKLAGFPNSTEVNWRGTSDPTAAYNCLSWSVHREDVWMWPDERQQFSWPRDMARAETIAVFRLFFETIGFRECTSALPEAGVQKIAVFGRHDFPEHVARQLSTGKWTSKLSDKLDIEHDDLGVLEDGTYGVVRLIMRRIWNGPPLLPPLNPPPPLLVTSGGMPLIP